MYIYIVTNLGERVLWGDLQAEIAMREAGKAGMSDEEVGFTFISIRLLYKLLRKSGFSF